ncbi:hypothetical protein G4G28_05825 [Massilia sp. Dwa41.01b]|uniref:hypothetical protein n=1 Tax=unclassified Massilia TaxID=2609279 RepID=UPI0015FF3427|nr:MULTISPECIES: hypothetical protein [unclassified Massilia]QNA88130.1 hypothetical protein G4G28_05825 [Massilia sp. Dwa41.01b]QNA99036.1 hypothetical protein G4G31_09550 [Massilia sp. Se16.2.3]
MITRAAFYPRLRRLLLASACCGAAGQPAAQGLTLRVPECQPVAPKALPEKYYALARHHKDFAWAQKVRRDQPTAGGNGWELIDGSEMRDWYSFYRVDINNDGYCDWYLNTSSPLSTGGDRDSINTLYLGRPQGWIRFGATVPSDKPDVLGFRKTAAEERRYLFGEEPGIIYDADQKISYLITALYRRHQRRDALPGYQILVWDARANILQALDKWQPGSKAASVYAYFKQHGAYVAPMDGVSAEEAVMDFDKEIETHEIRQACSADAEELAERKISPVLLATCKRPR